jgi:hypothetical protein
MLRSRPEKTKVQKTACTLDETHQNQMDTFKKMRDNLENKKKLLNDKTNELKKLENMNCRELSQNDMYRKVGLKNEIEKIKKDISRISSCEYELEYFNKTNSILMQYYDMLESRHQDCNSESVMPYVDLTNYNKKQSKKSNRNEEQQNNILTYFFSERAKAPENNTDNDVSKSDTDVPYKSEPIVPPKNRATLHKQYLCVMNNYGNSSGRSYDIVKFCKKCHCERTLVQNESAYTCPKCGEVEIVLMESDIPNYKDSNTEKTSYPYKRLNHFIEWLNQFQAKESTDIPKEAYDMITSELTHSRIGNIKNMSVTKMKEILKKLGLHKYYEHIPSIISRISGKHPPTINRETEEQLKQMFKAIQEPFAKHRPKNRTNFLSYSYVLHKFFQILNMPEFVERLPLLKSREKLRSQDKIWKQICDDLNWEFHPSI